MKHKVISAIFFMLTFSMTTVHAEVLLKDNKALVGNWQLNETAMKLSGERRRAKQSWQFRGDGKLISVADDKRVGGTSFAVTVNYEIQDGHIVSDQAGRPGKKFTYKVVELEDNRMVLHGGLDGYLFFTRK